MIRLRPLPAGALAGHFMWAAECDRCGRPAESVGERARDAAEFAGLDGWTVELPAGSLPTYVVASTVCPDCTLAEIGVLPASE